MATFSISIAGDSAVNLEFARTITPETSRLVRVAAQTLTDDPVRGIVEVMPTFCSLMVCYDPLVIGYDDLVAGISGKLRNLSVVTIQNSSGLKSFISLSLSQIIFNAADWTLPAERSRD